MKIMRPMLAAAAAIAIAAGTVPATAQETEQQAEAPENVVEKQELDAPDQPEHAAEGTATIKPLTVAPKNTATKTDQKWFKKVGENGLEAYSVYSPAMEREIPIAVRPARDKNGVRIDDAPTLYLLNGAGGAEQDNDWLTLAGGTFYETFKDEPVNVVIPMEGAFSYYVDWQTNPGEQGYYKGKQMWSTFLAKELPGAIEGHLNANDKRAVVGFSMSATSALLLAEHNPGMYDAVGSFSGCAATSTPLPYFYTGLTVGRGADGMTPESIWGPVGSDYNRYNDALVNAEKLRGTDLYISTATGLQSESDMFGTLLANNGGNPNAPLAASSMLTVEGGVIEGAMNACTHDRRAKLKSLNIPAHYELRTTGTHSWPGWHEDLKQSWNLVIKPALFDEVEKKPAADEGSANFSSANL